jgi:hypothetical protein
VVAQAVGACRALLADAAWCGTEGGGRCQARPQASARAFAASPARNLGVFRQPHTPPPGVPSPSPLPPPLTAVLCQAPVLHVSYPLFAWLMWSPTTTQGFWNWSGDHNIWGGSCAHEGRDAIGGDTNAETSGRLALLVVHGTRQLWTEANRAAVAHLPSAWSLAAGNIAWLLALAMLTTSYHYVRRRAYEVFKAAHYAFWAVRCRCLGGEGGWV